VLETPAGRRIAVTLTCAANAIGEVVAGSYAKGDATAAREAFRIAGEFLGVGGEALARRVLNAAAAKVAGVVIEALGDQKLDGPEVVGLGGGAGALVPGIAAAVGLPWRIPAEAEIISSIGDALSLVRVEVERTLADPTAEAVSRVHRDAEEAAIAAGAAPATIQLEGEAVPERGALRVIAYGAAALDAATAPDVSATDVAQSAAKRHLGDCALVARTRFYNVFASGSGARRRFAIVDHQGSVAGEVTGSILAGTGSEVARALEERIPALVRNYGPIAVAPALRLVRGATVVDLTLVSDPNAVREAALAECALAHDEQVVALLSRT
jgi:hypothetical protein